MDSLASQYYQKKEEKEKPVYAMTSIKPSEYDYAPVRSEAPQRMTMDRLAEMDELVLAQTTMLCFRTGICRPSINWVLNDASNYVPGSSPFELPNIGGWIHEESTFVQRCCFGNTPGCRETKFVQHSNTPPAVLRNEDWQCCVVQCEPTSDFLAPEELTQDIVAVHEKEMTLPTGCCCHQPYLTTKLANGQIIGQTKFVCDECLFVPKFYVYDQYGQIKYLLRPDTCLGGLCVMPRCGGRRGKCCRVPYLVRDPITREPVYSNVHEGASQITFLWSGLVNEACLKRHAYHVAFPQDATPEDRLTLIGSSILVDVALHEHEDDNNRSSN